MYQSFLNLTKQYFPLWSSLFNNHQDFYQNINDEWYHGVHEEWKLKYLVIKASHGDYYGFNLKIKTEYAYAMKIMSPNEPEDLW